MSNGIAALIRKQPKLRPFAGPQRSHIAAGHGCLYGAGYIPDRTATRLMQADSRWYYSSTTVADCSLKNYRGPQLDQNYTSSCVGHGTAQAVYTSSGAAGALLPFFPSPRIGYAIVRTLELNVYPPATSQPLTDSGAMPSDLVAVAQKWGFAPIGFGCTPAMPPTPDGYYTDCYQGNVNDKPSFADLEAAGMTMNIDALRVDESSTDFGAQISASLQNKAALGVGLFVDSAFIQWNGNSPVTSIDTSDPNGGGHWLQMDTIYTSGGVVIVGGDNSWGSRWGKRNGLYGEWEMTLDCLRQVCSDCLAFQVHP